MNATETMITLKVTWLDNDGNPVCLGLDETYEIDTDDFPEVETAIECARDAAVYQGECEGTNTERFHPHIEIIQESI